MYTLIYIRINKQEVGKIIYMSMSFIGERLKELRFKKNIKQKELADLLGVSQAQVSRYENYQDQPSYEVIEKMAEILDVSPEYLLGKESKSELKADFKERIKELIGEKSLRQIAKESGISASSLSLYMTDKRKPTLEAIELLSRYFSVSVDYLLGKTDTPDSLNKNEEAYRKILEMNKDLKLLPVFESASAGNGSVPLSIPISYIPVPPGYDGTMWVKIHGESMEPVIPDGSLVLVDENTIPKENDIVVAIVDGEIFCKYLHYHRDEPVLFSHTSAYTPIFINEHTNFKIIGKVVVYIGEVRRK